MLRLDLAKILPRRSVISCKAFKISHDSKKQIVDWIKQSFGDDVGYGSFVEVDQNLCNEIASMEDLAHSGKAMANYILWNIGRFMILRKKNAIVMQSNIL